MDVLLLVAASGALLLIAYFTYSKWLSNRVFALDNARPTPAVTEEDDSDYVPTKKTIVFGHHFTSIAGTGPIVGPAIAIMWGWLPAILWVIIGAIFVGAVHDLGSIVVSLRNKGRSIGDVAGDLLGPRVRLIFLSILIVGLWIVLAVFGLVIAAVLRQYPAAIFPVFFQIPIAVIIGLFIHRRGGNIAIASIISLALMYLSVIYGDVGFLHVFNTVGAAQPLWIWTIALLGYAYVASVLPVWILLQPRDYINALQLVTTLGLIVTGLVAAAFIGGAAGPSLTTESTEPTEKIAFVQNQSLEANPAASDTSTQESQPSSVSSVSKTSSAAASPSSTQNSPPPSVSSESSVPSVLKTSPPRPELEIVAPLINWQPVGAPPLLPVLFITIACGACSGFHCLVGSGTTSKQIAKERDARAIGYGSMLTEGFLATLVIAACVGGIGLGVVAIHAPSSKSRLTSITSQDSRRWIEKCSESFELIVPLVGPTDQLIVFGVVEAGYVFPTSVETDFHFEELQPFVMGGAFEIPDGKDAHSFAHAPPEDWKAQGIIPESLFTARIYSQDQHSEGRIVPKELILQDHTFSARMKQVNLRSADSDFTFDPTIPRITARGNSAFRTQYSSWAASSGLSQTVGAFVQGAANFLAALGIPIAIATALIAVMVASFAATTMDTACRLQRYVIQELSHTFLPTIRSWQCKICTYDLSAHVTRATSQRGVAGDTSPAQQNESKDSAASHSADPQVLHAHLIAQSISITCPECGTTHPAHDLYHHDKSASWSSAFALNPFKWLATVHGATLFAVISAALLSFIPPAGQSWSLDNAGKGGMILWPLFGATNQLLGGFAFIVITAWLIATRKPIWFIIIPTVFMLCVPAAAMTWQAFIGNDANASWLSQRNWLLVTIATVTLALEAWLLIETAIRWRSRTPALLTNDR